MLFNGKDRSRNWSKFEIAIVIFFFLISLVTIAGLIFVLFYSKIPANFSEKLTGEKIFELKMQSLTARIEAFKTIALVFAANAILFNLYYTSKRADSSEKNNLSAKTPAEEVEEGKITDRFTKAIEQLGSENPTIRIGGIYALERMANNLDIEPWTIIELLTAFIREKTGLKALHKKNVENETQDSQSEEESPKLEDKDSREAKLSRRESRLPIDIQAALTVIGRRDTENEQEDRIIDLRHTNIAGADVKKANLQRAILTQCNMVGAILFGANLQGAILYGVDLEGAILLGADLQGAILTESNLQGAVFTECNLQGAVFWKANLQGANLTEANLEGAILYGANLQGAILKEANLQGAILTEANLQGAILSRAENLDPQQIESAFGDSTTVLPKYLARPEKWKQSD